MAGSKRRSRRMVSSVCAGGLTIVFVVAGLATPANADTPPIWSGGTPDPSAREPITPSFGLPYTVPLSVTMRDFPSGFDFAAKSDLDPHWSQLAKPISDFVPQGYVDTPITYDKWGNYRPGNDLTATCSHYDCWTVLQLDEVAPVISTTNPILAAAGMSISDMLTTSTTHTKSYTRGVTFGGNLSAKFEGSGPDASINYAMSETDSTAYASGDNQTATAVVQPEDVGKWVSLESRAEGGNYVGVVYVRVDNNMGDPSTVAYPVRGFLKAPGVTEPASWDKVVRDPSSGAITRSAPTSGGGDSGGLTVGSVFGN